VVPATSSTAAIVTAPALTVNGSSTLKVSGSPVNGTILVDYTGTIGGAGFGGLSLVMPFRSSGTLFHDEADTKITLSNVQSDTLKWKGNVDSNWDTTTSNWILASNSSAAQYTQTGVGQTDAPLFDDTAVGNTAITLNTSVTPIGVTFNNSSLSYSVSGSGSIGGAGSIVKSGSGALTLATANTFTGGVQLNGGTLNINHASALGSGALTIAAGTTLNNTSGAAITLSANNGQNWNGDFTFTGSNDLNLGTGSIALPSDRSVTVNSGNLTVGGLSGTGFGLTKAGSGTLIVGANSYTGNTTINGGTIRGTSASSFANTASVTVATGATLDLGGNNQTVSNIFGSGTLQLNGATLTTGTASSSTFAGALVGAGGLIKAGTGTFTLSGDKSGYTGNTTINAGVLDVGTVGGSFGNLLTMNNGAVIQANGSLTGTVGNGNQIVSGNGGFGARGGNLTINFGGAGMAVSFNSSGGVFGGGLFLGSNSSDSRVILQNGWNINNFNAQRTITVNPGTGTASAEITGIVANGSGNGNTGINKQGAGDLILSNANTISGTTSINAGRIVLGNPLALQYAILTTNVAGQLVVTGYTTPTIGGLIGDLDVSGLMAEGYSSITTLTLNPQAGVSVNYAGSLPDGATGMNLVKTGAGTQTLSGTNDYTGSTSVLGGNLTIGASSTLGSTTAPLIVGNPNITSNGTAVLLNLPAGVSTVTGPLSGSIATLSGNLTGTNTATINNGGAGTDYTVNQTANGTYAGVIAGNGTFTLGAASTSTLTFTGANTYAGGTTISGGTLALGDGTTTGSVVGDIVNNSALVLSPGASNLPLTGVISGSGSVTKSGANAVVLSADNTYAGGTTVAQGVLSVTNSSGSATGTGAVSIGETGTLTGSGTISGAVTVSGILAPGNNIGTLTLGSSLTFTSGSTLAIDLGTASDQLAFASSATVSGSGLPALALTLGEGFDYATSYPIISNVATTGFTFSAVTGYDSGNYTATVQKSGSNYVLSFSPTSGSPTYASWATDNGINGEPAGGDFDQDGVANAVEMVLGGNPASVSDTALLPTLAIVTNPAGVPAGTYMEYTYRRTALSVSASVTSVGQYSTDLLAAWTTAVDGVAGVELIETADFYGSGVDRVQVYVPKGANTRLFGRLNVTVPVAP
jgi:autotransporter-associated beta strand protein